MINRACGSTRHMRKTGEQKCGDAVLVVVAAAFLREEFASKNVRNAARRSPGARQGRGIASGKDGHRRSMSRGNSVPAFRGRDWILRGHGRSFFVRRHEAGKQRCMA